ncbi:MmcQ/YjbR family DNA-binding protein [Phenylobacterium sp.]|uniref:MmcQ/YjbR family DNA-binding protein n=1 Tax=Phenylobacterium sp. TaxID=1871053 RepID=UPI002DEFCB64|nr:MmcQ/YjbR family DNA-binding protein [Phenylobacterium sp.]
MSWGSPEMDRAGIEQIAFALPAVTRVVQWGGSDVYKVGGKVFGICGDEAISFKVSEIGFVVLTEAGGPGRQAPYCAKGQWVAVDFTQADDEDFKGWLATAHSLISGKLTKKARVELGLGS